MKSIHLIAQQHLGNAVCLSHSLDHQANTVTVFSSVFYFALRCQNFEHFQLKRRVNDLLVEFLALWITIVPVYITSNIRLRILKEKYHGHMPTNCSPRECCQIPFLMEVHASATQVFHCNRKSGNWNLYLVRKQGLCRRVCNDMLPHAFLAM